LNVFDTEPIANTPKAATFAAFFPRDCVIDNPRVAMAGG